MSEWTECPEHEYSDEGATECLECPNAENITSELDSDGEVKMKEKCQSMSDF